MSLSSSISRSGIVLLTAICLPLTLATAAEPLQLVFQNGRSVPLSAVNVQGETLTISAPAQGFNPGQTFPLSAIDHVYGDKPAEIYAGMALLLLDKPAEALKLLEPIIAAQRSTAKIPGNFWVEAAQAALVAYAIEGNAAKCNELGKEISDASPIQGTDPIVSLGKALLLPSTTPVKDREVALSDLMTNNMPADVSAYAALYRAKLFAATKREDEALESFLTVSAVYPSGGLILNAVAEFKAAEILQAKGRREEAVALLTSSVLHSAGTLVAAEANKRLESIK